MKAMLAALEINNDVCGENVGASKCQTAKVTN